MTWAWARDLHRRCIYYPEHVYTWEDIVITLLVHVSVYVSVCPQLIAS